MQNLVLIAEDEPEITDILVAYLERSGFRTIRADDGVRALELHQQLRPDLVLLDIQMPGMDGWKVLTEIRHRGETPVIMLTALDQDLDKLMGLRIGADDYIAKPFNPAEVIARVQAVLRRSAVAAGTDARVVRAEGIQVDMDRHQVHVDTPEGLKPLTLTLTEFRILAVMVRSPHRVFSRQELLAHCLGESDALERTVDSHVSKLRKKLDEQGIDNTPASVRGVGYVLRGRE